MKGVNFQLIDLVQQLTTDSGVLEIHAVAVFWNCRAAHAPTLTQPRNRVPHS
jgi:hypothetical protein